MVGSDIEGGESLLAADDESSCDNRVVGLTVNGASAKDVLAAGLKTGEEATCTSQYWLLPEASGCTYRSGWQS